MDEKEKNPSPSGGIIIRPGDGKKSGECTQLGLLLRKNYLLKKRNCKRTCSEIFVPLIAPFCLLLLRGIASTSDFEDDFHLTDSISTSWNPQLGPLPFTDENVPTYIERIACGARNNGRFADIDTLPITFAIAATDDLKNERESLAVWIRKEFTTLSLAIPTTNCSSAPLICIFPWNRNHPNCKDVPETRVNLFDMVNRPDFVKTYSSREEMFNYVESDSYASGGNPAHFMGITLLSGAPKWNYVIHLNQSKISPVSQFTQAGTWSGTDYFQWPLEGGYISLQYLVDDWILFNDNKGRYFFNSSSPAITYVPFPTLAYSVDVMSSVISFFAGLLFLVPMIWPFTRLVANIVIEKERRVKEGMKMMGLRAIAFWSSWAITYAIIFTITSAFIVLFGTAGFFLKSDTSVIFLTFWLFGMTMVSLGCMLGALFSRGKSAGSMSGFIIFVMWIISGQIDNYAAESVQSLVFLMSPAAFSIALARIFTLESQLIGARTDNISEYVGNYNLTNIYWMMVLDFFLYAFFAWYFDKTVRGDYGTSLPPYFCFDPNYWCPNSIDKQKQRRTSSVGMDDLENKNKDIQTVSEELKKREGVEIKNLRKVFGSGENKHVAVSKLNLKLFEGQIFVLLGHNGAGKTTTINMLTGMMSPSSGTALMYGKDVRTDMREIRTFVGVCPQHDILFDLLTVKEHLQMFALLKGIKKEDIEKAADEAVTDVSLKAKLDAASQDLSGGQKRRLSLAIALIGGSKVLFLDEPTSGVDPASRRAIWDLLNAKKEGRVIILTTHFMDEADILGDRIAILHKGVIKCCGTPLFLKNQFGVGYNITMAKTDSSVDSKLLISTIREHIPTTTVLSNSGTEVSMRLPLSASSKFPSMLKELETNGEKIGCSNFGISVTTMEEVFLRVAREEEDPQENIRTRESISKLQVQRGQSSGNLEILENTEEVSNLGVYHFKAMMAKRFHVCKRDKKAFCCQFLLPVILLLVGQLLITNPPGIEMNTQSLIPQIYKNPNLPFYYNELYNDVPTNLIDVLSPDGLAMQPVKESMNSQLNFSQKLLTVKNDWAESMYGAFFQDSYTLDGSQLTKEMKDEMKDKDFMGRNLLQGNNRSTSQQVTRNNIYTNHTARYGLFTFWNVLSNGLYQDGDREKSINVNIQPFPKTKTIKFAETQNSALFMSIIISMSFSFIPTVYIVFLVKERELKAKHIQIVSGVQILAYWLSNFIFDFLCFLIPALISSLIVLATATDAYTSEDSFPILVLSIIMYGLAVIPFTYFCSFFFKSPSSAQNVMLLIYIFTGVFFTLIVFFLSVIPSDVREYAWDIRMALRIFPNFCLGDTVLWLALSEFGASMSFETVDKWNWDTSGYNRLFLGLEGLIYFVLVIILDSLILANKLNLECLNCDKELSHLANQGRGRKEDIDIENEKKRIEAGPNPPELISLRGLRKVYPSKVAVNDLWFSIPAGECFGFLGQNGAGKSTTLKMITGDCIPTEGNVLINNISAVQEPWRIRKYIGYCPQFDALHPLMTAEETLTMYARIRGYPEAKIPKMVAYLCKRLTLDQDNQHKRPCGTYSGGNKRKLSVAMALIGSPKCVMLDEPSTGMDPVSRRFMWDFISETMGNRAVILTTHSMEECEALCSRISILVHGRLRCVGSSQHLKNRFGTGFEFRLSIKNEEYLGKARQWIQETFANSAEIESYGGNLKYKLGKQDIPLSEVFTCIEENRENIGITEYSVGQTTLEQIFINFAKDGEAEYQAMLNGDKYVSKIDLGGNEAKLTTSS